MAIVRDRHRSEVNAHSDAFSALLESTGALKGIPSTRSNGEEYCDCGRKVIGRTIELGLSYTIEGLDDEADSNLKGLRHYHRAKLIAVRRKSL